MMRYSRISLKFMKKKDQTVGFQMIVKDFWERNIKQKIIFNPRIL